jgi:hypothetical protein
VGLCPRHRRNRARAIALGWLAALAGLGSIIAGGMVSDSLEPIALIGGIVLLLVGMICGAVGSQVLVPRRIDKHFVWLSKVSPDYYPGTKETRSRSGFPALSGWKAGPTSLPG